MSTYLAEDITPDAILSNWACSTLDPTPHFVTVIAPAGRHCQSK